MAAGFDILGRYGLHNWGISGPYVKIKISMLDNNVITLNQLTSNNRFYFPEVQIAENGIFVYSVTTAAGTKSLIDGLPWTKVDNLNTHARSSYVFKFGFDIARKLRLQSCALDIVRNKYSGELFLIENSYKCG